MSLSSWEAIEGLRHGSHHTRKATWCDFSVFPGGSLEQHQGHVKATVQNFPISKSRAGPFWGLEWSPVFMFAAVTCWCWPGDLNTQPRMKTLVPSGRWSLFHSCTERSVQRPANCCSSSLLWLDYLFEPPLLHSSTEGMEVSALLEASPGEPLGRTAAFLSFQCPQVQPAGPRGVLLAENRGRVNISTAEMMRSGDSPRSVLGKEAPSSV